MSKYNPFLHDFVSIKYPDETVKEFWSGVFDIVLKTPGRVWVRADHNHLAKAHQDVRLVLDTNPINSMDEDGGCVISVPEEWCTFLTQDDASQLVAAMEADAKLLLYAIG